MYLINGENELRTSSKKLATSAKLQLQLIDSYNKDKFIFNVSPKGNLNEAPLAFEIPKAISVVNIQQIYKAAVEPENGNIHCNCGLPRWYTGPIINK